MLAVHTQNTISIWFHFDDILDKSKTTGTENRLRLLGTRERWLRRALWGEVEIQLFYILILVQHTWFYAVSKPKELHIRRDEFYSM